MRSRALRGFRKILFALSSQSQTITQSNIAMVLIMHAAYVDEMEAKHQGIVPGWYVFDEDGRRVSGPFESEEAAEEWIAEHSPEPPEPKPSRGFHP